MGGCRECAPPSPEMEPFSSYSLLKLVFPTSKLRLSLLVHPLLRSILEPPLGRQAKKRTFKESKKEKSLRVICEWGVWDDRHTTFVLKRFTYRSPCLFPVRILLSKRCRRVIKEVSCQLLYYITLFSLFYLYVDTIELN